MGDPIAKGMPEHTVFTYDADDLEWAKQGVPFWPYRETDDFGYPITAEEWLRRYYAARPSEPS